MLITNTNMINVLVNSPLEYITFDINGMEEKLTYEMSKQIFLLVNKSQKKNQKISKEYIFFSQNIFCGYNLSNLETYKQLFKEINKCRYNINMPICQIYYVYATILSTIF